MPDRRQRQHLVAYDIADPRRLQKIHRTLKGWGIALQYSVFLVRANKRQIQELITELQRKIDPRADDVRIYPLPDQPRMDILGCQDGPDGLMLLAEDGEDLLHPGRPRGSPPGRKSHQP